MEDEPLDLSMNSASWTKETSKEKQHVAEKVTSLLPVKSKETLVAEFSSSEENSRKTSEQESKKSFYSRKINKIDKPLESQDVILASHWKTKRKLSEDPSKNLEAKRRRDTYPATSRKTEDKQRLPGASDYSDIASADYISSRPSTSADGNSSNEQCGKGFSRNSRLDRHFRTHKVEKPFKCQQCEKTFSRKSFLEEHTIRVHTNPERSYQCNKCEKSFALKRDLTDHSKRHTTVKPFLCNKCEKSFITQRELDMHSLTHAKEKPFPCKECGKSFATKNELTGHSYNTHTREKPFLCIECGKSFPTKNKLTRHSYIHTGEKPFLCNECGKSYATKSNLNQHSRTHTRLRPYGCKTCGKAYTSKQNLNNHENTHKEK